MHGSYFHFILKSAGFPTSMWVYLRHLYLSLIEIDVNRILAIDRMREITVTIERVIPKYIIIPAIPHALYLEKYMVTKNEC